MKRILRLHPRLTSALICLSVILLAGLNILFFSLTQKNAAYGDLTPERLYTKTALMDQVIDRISSDVTVTFCDDPDHLLASVATRYVYILAQQMAKRNSHIKLVTVNSALDPTAVYQYRTTSASEIKPDDVIVSAGSRYRIYSAASFYTVSSDGDSSRFWSFNGEYKFATAMLSVTSLSQPRVYFTYGHGERIYVSPDDEKNSALLGLSDEEMRAFYDLMQGEGLSVGYLNPDLVQSVPDDCVLLVMCGPKTDYTEPNPTSFSHISAQDVIHNYLSEHSGSFMLFRDPGYSLPHLEELAEQWGVRFRDVVIKDSHQSAGTDTALVADYNTSDTEMSYGVYAPIADMVTPPRTVLGNCGSVSMSWRSHEQATSSTKGVEAYYSAFLFSSPTALAYTHSGLVADDTARAYQLAALTTRIRTDATTTDSEYSYFFGCATTDMVTNKYLSEAAYGNYDVIFALVRYISRTDVYAAMQLGGVSLNSENLGGKQIEYNDLYATDKVLYEKGERVVYRGLSAGALTVWTLLLSAVMPAAVVGVCMFVRARRKYR